MVVSKTNDHIQIKIKMPNPHQEPQASSKAPNEDLKDMDALCTFKIKIGRQNWEYSPQLHLENQDREPKFRTWVYQRLVTIAKSGLRYQTLVRNLHRPLKSQIRT